MNATAVNKFVDVLGFIDASLLGEWRLLWCDKPGRWFADLVLLADRGFIERLGIIPQLEATGVKVRQLGKKGTRRRWRVEFPERLAYQTAAMSARKRFRENTNSVPWLFGGNGERW